MHKLITTLLFTVFVQIGFAQHYFGFNIGANFATLILEDDFSANEVQSLFGISANAYVDIKTGKNFSLQPQLNYLQKGTRIKDGSFEDVNFTLTFIDLDFLIKYRFSTDEIKPYAFIGPTIGYALKAKIKDNESGVSEELEFGEDIDLKQLDYGLAIGGGMAIPFEIGELTLDMRYLLGVANLSDDSSTKIKTRGIGVQIGMRFPFSKNEKE